MTRPNTLQIQSLLLIILALILPSCERVQPAESSEFTLEDEIRLGEVLATTIAEDPTTYPILDRELYPEVYAFVESIQQKLFVSTELTNRSNFDWEIIILKEDETGKAFTLPGGPMYISTALLRFFTSEHQLAAMMAHEMAYADQHLAREFLAIEYGPNIMLDVALGSNPELANAFVNKLSNTVYPDGLTSQADEFSIQLLCPTDFQATGLMDIIESVEMLTQLPFWIRNRPGSPQRINDLINWISNLNCQGILIGTENYTAFLDQLPE